MRLFRRVPTPFAITYLVSSLLRESVQKRKADKYAAQAVHYYKPGESPYPSRTVLGNPLFQSCCIQHFQHLLLYLQTKKTEIC